MKFDMTMTAAEITTLMDTVNQIFPDTVDLDKIMPAPGKSKITTIKNQKILIETYENSDVISCQYDLDPDFMVAVFEMLGGFAGNIAGACKALMKHGKLLKSIMGAEEIIQKINGMTVGKECDGEGNPLNIEKENICCNEETGNEETNNKEEDIPQSSYGPEEKNPEADDEEPSSIKTMIETPIADMASQLGFDV